MTLIENKINDNKVVNGCYQLYEKIGEGGMGAVYLAMERLTNEPVALKQVTQLVHQTAADTITTEDDHASRPRPRIPDIGWAAPSPYH